MNTSIIYEVNEDYAGIPKDWSARIIGVFDNLTLVQFCDDQKLYALFEKQPIPYFDGRLDIANKTPASLLIFLTPFSNYCS